MSINEPIQALSNKECKMIKLMNDEMPVETFIVSEAEYRYLVLKGFVSEGDTILSPETYNEACYRVCKREENMACR